MTVSGSARRRGQPLVALGLVLAGWAGLRMALWEDLAMPPNPAPGFTATRSPRAVPPPPVTRILPERKPTSATPAPVSVITSALRLPEPQPGWRSVVAPLPPKSAAAGSNPVNADGPRLAGGHQIAWIAGLAQLPAPSFLRDRSGASRPDPATPQIPPRTAPPAPRWSADTWLLLRQGGLGSGAGGLPPPAYGASQVGGVVRYRPAPASRMRPALYLRTTAATTAPHGEEAALGLSFRPLVRVPVTLSGEVRVANIAGSPVLRPAAMLVTEFDRFVLPAGLRGEVYGQAGYVGGRAGTPFADGQLRIDRALAQLGQAELRAGGGVWGGAQRGAGRLDLGPAATLDFPLGSGRARIAADWRMRLAGQAAPQSGPALTLSAGF